MAGRTKAWFWVLGVVIVALVVALVVVLVSSDDDTPRATPASTPTTAARPVITDDPATYARYLFAAWQNRNRTDAANVASADAVSQMFAQAYPAQGPYAFANCDPAAGSLHCTWNGRNGATIQMTVRTLTGGLPIQVQSVTFGS